jgi:hypothetical protein
MWLNFIGRYLFRCKMMNFASASYPTIAPSAEGEQFVEVQVPMYAGDLGGEDVRTESRPTSNADDDGGRPTDRTAGTSSGDR